MPSHGLFIFSRPCAPAVASIAGYNGGASTLTGIFIERLWGFFDRRLKGAAAYLI